MYRFPKIKRFQVWMDDNMDYFCVESFDTLDEAKEYCKSNTDGLSIVDDIKDKGYYNHNDNFHYEVYDGAPVVITDDKDGNPLSVAKDSLYDSNQFYFK